MNNFIVIHRISQCMLIVSSLSNVIPRVVEIYSLLEKVDEWKNAKLIDFIIEDAK